MLDSACARRRNLSGDVGQPVILVVGLLRAKQKRDRPSMDSELSYVYMGRPHANTDAIQRAEEHAYGGLLTDPVYKIPRLDIR